MLNLHEKKSAITCDLVPKLYDVTIVTVIPRIFSDVIEDGDDDDVERAPKMSTFKSSSLRQHGSTAQRRTSTAARMRVRGEGEKGEGEISLVFGGIFIRFLTRNITRKILTIN